MRALLAAATAAAAVLLAACGGPFLLLPGGALSGTPVTTPVQDWSEIATDAFVDLEVRPEDPYSVELNYVLRDGKLYIDPAEGRRWFDHLRQDPRVRVRFGDRIYPGVAVLVGRPGELPGFDADRYVYRIDSRPPGGAAEP
jgi:hypothetical protein